MTLTDGIIPDKHAIRLQNWNRLARSRVIGLWSPAALYCMLCLFQVAAAMLSFQRVDEGI